jgi:thymidylate kinase
LRLTQWKASCMIAKLFVLGHPGSGKSTVSRYIVDYVGSQRNGWTANRFNDYDIMLEMFLSEEHKHRFHPTHKHLGFNVHDPLVYDEALKKLENIVKTPFSSSHNELIVIEFARNDYKKALQQFSPDFLSNTYIIFLDVDISICLRRINERVAHPTGLDDHYVSSKIFRNYRHTNPKQYISSNLKTDFDFDEDTVLIINNKGEEKDFTNPINHFINTIFKQVSGNLFISSR